MEQFLFYFFAVVLVFAGTMVVTARNPVHSALFLVLAFFTSAGLWLLLDAEFLALVLVMVYVGAVLVLFLFVVMMVDVNLAPVREGFVRHLPVVILLVVVVAIELWLVVGSGELGMATMSVPLHHPPDYSNTKALGVLIYTSFVYPFEIAAVLLLVAIVAAIALTMRRRRGLKAIDPAKAVAVEARGRVRLVDLRERVGDRAPDHDPSAASGEPS